MGVIDAYKNLAVSSVLTAPSPAVSGTSLVLPAGEGARFPAVPFNAAVWPAGGIPTPANAEVIRVTARATDTLTITRAQEGSTARAILGGDFLAAVFTEKFVADLRDSSNQNAGILPDARHSANVPLLNLANTFTGAFQDVGAALRLRNPGGPVDHRAWTYLSASDGTLQLFAQNDANSANEVGYNLVVSRLGNLQVYGDLYEKNRPAPMGHWVDVPFNPANFFASGGGTWTVGAAAIINNRYALIGKTLHWELYVSWFSGANVVAGTVTSVNINAPGGFQPRGPTGYPVAAIVDNGIVGPGYAGPSGVALTFTRLPQANYTPGSVGILSALAFEIY